jgi:mRNA-degrading endonuclease YafQ of YafQ-DinJ toxin-antitoxin module
MYQLAGATSFERRLRRFRRAHPELDERLRGLFRDLQTDPFQPRLRLHPLQAELEGPHAVSLTYRYRLLLRVLPDEQESILVDIGAHDEVYR